uniref:Uncharacterized protein n=1 Tax=viral metagenome TaxID=1070528 RepID=A0A6C0JJS2_9ZZZZ
MPVYFGFPVSCEEAFRLFGQDFEGPAQTIMEQRNYRRDSWFIGSHLVPLLNKYLANNQSDLRLFETDKGACVIGYKIMELCGSTDNYIEVNNLLGVLITLKQRFDTEMRALSVDLSYIVLQRVEEEPETVHNPKPFVITHSTH